MKTSWEDDIRKMLKKYQEAGVWELEPPYLVREIDNFIRAVVKEEKTELLKEFEDIINVTYALTIGVSEDTMRQAIEEFKKAQRTKLADLERDSKK